MSELGIDFDVLTDLSPTFGTVSGRAALAQSIARRLQTSRGHWPFDPEMGFNLLSAVSSSIDPNGGLGLIAAQVEEQCIQDPRVDEVDVKVQSLGGSAIEVIVMLTDADGPFELVIPITEWTGSLVVEVR